ncbi:GIY-YIG nuclease family protein [Maribrevibacterium harenarium]|uniref:GIY-YIG nuclease family protein n=1 Tax=Maribrevibacterium harenarium TaxID=2589817 RepID=A0A501WY78_9GAMM|nr:GIY-YIG nuclease family protein [Maribrevibacterium harenarium]TPE51961.1 GIY-YIG nuclease family protein [Maribrevibacterium harenarium]
MVVFKITNSITGKHYIGTSFNSGFQRFEQYVEAAEEGLDYPLYEEIRTHGTEAFNIEELYDTSDKEELYELEQDYLAIYNAESLRGYKIGQSTKVTRSFDFGKKAMFDTNGVSTTAPAPSTRKKAAATTSKTPAPAVETPAPKPTVASFFGELIGEDRLDAPAAPVQEDFKKPSTVTRPKKSTADIQRMLREAEKKSKEEREAKLKAAQEEQAQEMAMIMAKLDVTAKSAMSSFRRRKG